jgi:hypothetical protein
VDFFGKRLKRQETVIPALHQSLDLPDVSETIGLVDQYAVRVTHVCDGDGGISDTRDMNKARTLGKQLLLAGKVMMESVMHQFEGAASIYRIDPSDGFGFQSQGANLETKRLDKAREPPFAEDFAQCLECSAEVGLPFAVSAPGTVIDRHQYEGLCAAGHGIVCEMPSLCRAFIRPCVKALQGIDRHEGDARGLCLSLHQGGRGPIEDGLAGKIVADLDSVQTEGPARSKNSLIEARGAAV